MYSVREQWEASVSEGGGEWFDDVDDFEIQHGEECDFGRSGFKVGVNEREFVIGVRFQVEELHCEISGRIANGCGGTSGIGMSDELAKPESDVSCGLNDGMNDLGDVVVFLGEDMIAKNGLLKACKCHGIRNKRFASGKIDGNPVNRETVQIVESHVRD